MLCSRRKTSAYNDTISRQFVVFMLNTDLVQVDDLPSFEIRGRIGGCLFQRLLLILRFHLYRVVGSHVCHADLQQMSGCSEQSVTPAQVVADCSYIA